LTPFLDPFLDPFLGPGLGPFRTARCRGLIGLRVIIVINDPGV